MRPFRHHCGHIKYEIYIKKFITTVAKCFNELRRCKAGYASNKITNSEDTQFTLHKNTLCKSKSESCWSQLLENIWHTVVYGLSVMVQRYLQKWQTQKTKRQRDNIDKNIHCNTLTCSPIRLQKKHLQTSPCHCCLCTGVGSMPASPLTPSPTTWLSLSMERRWRTSSTSSEKAPKPPSAWLASCSWERWWQHLGFGTSTRVRWPIWTSSPECSLMRVWCKGRLAKTVEKRMATTCSGRRASGNWMVIPRWKKCWLRTSAGPSQVSRFSPGGWRAQMIALSCARKCTPVPGSPPWRRLSSFPNWRQGWRKFPAKWSGFPLLKLTMVGWTDTQVSRIWLWRNDSMHRKFHHGAKMDSW